MITFNTNGMVYQRFGFPAPIMNYILKNLQPHHLIKLYPCCKFFYAEYGINIIQNLEIVANGKAEIFHPSKTVMCFSTLTGSKLLKDFLFTDSLIYRAPFYPIGIPEFEHCEIKKLELRNTILWKDFETFTKAETVQELKVLRSIYFITGKYFSDASVDMIIARVPNATSIEIVGGIFAETTCSSLVSLDHKAKIKTFVLRNIMDFDYFDLELFTDFILKNADDDCNVHLDFQLFDIDDNADDNESLVEMGQQYTDQIKVALEMRKNGDCMSENMTN